MLFISCSLFNGTVSKTASNYWMTVNNEVDGMWKEAVGA
jgi:hypothetical protein